MYSMNTSSYRFSLILIFSIMLGGVVGVMWGPHALILKPLGTLFLHLLYTVIIPLIFFSVANAMVGMGEFRLLKKMMGRLFAVCFVMSAIAAIFMMLVVWLCQPTKNVVLTLAHTVAPLQHIDIGEQLANMITVPNLTQLLLPDNILALVVVAILVGLAANVSGEAGKPFAQLLKSGTEVFMKLISFIMYYAPIGFFAFFAVLSAKLGPVLFDDYFRSFVIYYAAGIIYFFVGFTAFVFLAHKKAGVVTFWKYVTPPAMTALATCSSAASIPVNLQAVRNMGVSQAVNEVVTPLGTILHKDGSVLGGVLKIAFLFGIFHLSFTTPFALISTFFVSILVGTVMGAIPSGGMLGEMLILSVYGFPPQALLIIATISILIDPLATVLNVISNTVCSLLVERLTHNRG